MAEICGILAGILVLILLFKPFFGDGDGFWECVRFSFIPDIISCLRGEWARDWWAELKLNVWFFCGVLVGGLVYVGIEKLN
ncbi:hypothetical protein PN462_17025 [Spirulina sp. CS-785/01]|uniref:hypothetical protein n=1 Tax=Spirulina sp. CS-785/01 TaxID=3021716 RepID=UPI00232F56B3|nr:hypothetical protein [Spirulina sp. CS-785/01]MDB9314819.1 hypothetical protein [Spirulina sp. CS-785/01]